MLPLATPVRDAAFSPDGSTFVTRGDDKTARLWNAETGVALASLHHDDEVQFVAYRADGRLVLTCGKDKTARIWKAASGEPVAVLHHDDAVGMGAFATDNRTVLTCSKDNTARLWDATTGTLLATLRHRSEVRSGAFSPDNRTVLTVGPDVQLWDVATGQLLLSFHHDSGVDYVSLSPDGRLAITCCRDKSVRLWDVVAPVPDQPELVQTWAAVRTRRAWSDQGVLRELGYEEWLHARQQLSSQGANWEAIPPRPRWHLAQARMARAEAQWFGLIFHLDRVLATGGSAELFCRRAEAHGQLRHWDRAVADYTAALKLAADDADARSGRAQGKAQLGRWTDAVADYRRAWQLRPEDASLGCLLAQAFLGNADGVRFRETCGELLTRFGQAEQTSIADEVAWVCVLTPDAVADHPSVVRLMEHSVAKDPENWSCRETLGAALFRAGEFTKAADELNRAFPCSRRSTRGSRRRCRRGSFWP